MASHKIITISTKTAKYYNNFNRNLVQRQMAAQMFL